jgi:hypothetical protein
MSELGQTRRFDRQPATTGVPQLTDIVRPAPLVRFVPEAVVNDRASVSAYFIEKQTYIKPGVALPLCGASSSALRMVGLLHQKQRTADC